MVQAAEVIATRRSIRPNEAHPSALDRFCSGLKKMGFLIQTGNGSELALEKSGYVLYGNAPIYYQAALRNHLRCAMQGDIGLCLAPAPNHLHLNEETPVVVMLRPGNQATLAWLRENARETARRFGVNLVVKAVDSAWVREAAHQHGFSTYRDGEYWHPLAKYDDQMFPEIVILNGMLPHRVRRLLDMVEPRVYDPSLKGEVEYLFAAWRTWFEGRYPGWWSQSLNDFYAVLLAEDALVCYQFARIYYFQGKPCAFACGDFVTDQQADLWASFALPFRNELPRAVFASAIHECHELGADAVNLGGSEESGLDWFKRRLGSYREKHTTHLVVRAQD